MDRTSKVLVFDPFSGASGDMIIGCLVNLGADQELVIHQMEKAADVTVSISDTKQGLISASRVEVVQKSFSQLTYSQVIDHIRTAGLPQKITEDVLGIMELIGRSEAAVHGTPLDKLHLHEMGQQDAIADITGSVVAFHNLELTRVVCLPISVGSGFVDTSHGKLPVPAPATLEILNSSGLLWKGGPVQHELLTPTGAAILAYLINKYGTSNAEYPQMISSRAGYGAGSKETGLPNVLRTVLGEFDTALAFDYIEMLETSVDDVTGEVLGYLIQELMDDGALDVSIIPATMKKGRTGVLIKVICKAPDTRRLARRIIIETGSLGVRQVSIKHRFTVQRKMIEVEIRAAGRSHHARVKVGCDNEGEILNISAEFDDCKKIAQESRLPVKDILRLAEDEARSHLGKK